MTEQWFDFKNLNIEILRQYPDRIKVEINTTLDQITSTL